MNLKNNKTKSLRLDLTNLARLSQKNPRPYCAVMDRLLHHRCLGHGLRSGQLNRPAELMSGPIAKENSYERRGTLRASVPNSCAGHPP